MGRRCQTGGGDSAPVGWPIFMKRTLNVKSVARIFKPLWKPTGKLKLRDLGENIFLFEFSDVLDLDRVLEFEP